ncbi:MAG TPA: HNH endonuclease, partial [Pedococcus sp.]|nr:HNH endonuclease [Pedococcus sp.]
MEPLPAVAPAPLTTVELAEFLSRLPDLDVDGVPDAERIDQLGLLESIKAAAAGAQARVSVAFADSQREQRAARGVPARERGRGLGAQVALARRESPHRGSRHLGLALALVGELPHTFAHLRAGRVSEWRATIVCRETACLTREDRGRVDVLLAEVLPTLGDR